MLEKGAASVGDNVVLIERAQPDWSVARVTSARPSRKVSQRDAETLAALPELANGWCQAFQRMADGNLEEDASKHLSNGEK